MTFCQCQNILHIGKNTLLNLLHDRQLDGFKIGSRWRITRENLEEFIEHARWER